MPEVLGAMNIASRALPTGIDGTKVAEWELRRGYTYQQFVNEVSLAIAAVNEELRAEAGPVSYITEEIQVEYPDGGSVTEMPEITDADDIESVSGTTIGHMLPFKTHGRAVGTTWLAARDLRSAQVESTIATLVNQARWRFSKSWMRRLFTNTENAIGSGGYDVPWVRGTGGNVDYTPPAWKGEAFASSHDHFIGVDSGSKTWANVFDELAETVEEHGHEAPFRAIVPKVDISTITNLTNFKRFVSQRSIVIDRGGASSGNQFFVTGQPTPSGGLIGYYESNSGEIEVYASSRLATGYGSLYKSYGDNDARNPLACRVYPDVGFGMYLRPEFSGDIEFPIKKIRVVFEFGFGVWRDRTAAAVARLVSGGAWTNPTIS